MQIDHMNLRQRNRTLYKIKTEIFKNDKFTNGSYSLKKKNKGFFEKLKNNKIRKIIFSNGIISKNFRRTVKLLNKKVQISKIVFNQIL